MRKGSSSEIIDAAIEAFHREGADAVLPYLAEPAIEGRPAGEHARRIVPDPPGRIGPAFPQEWLASLQARVAH